MNNQYKHLELMNRITIAEWLKRQTHQLFREGSRVWMQLKWFFNIWFKTEVYCPKFIGTKAPIKNKHIWNIGKSIAYMNGSMVNSGILTFLHINKHHLTQHPAKPLVIYPNIHGWRPWSSIGIVHLPLKGPGSRTITYCQLCNYVHCTAASTTFTGMASYS